MPPLSELGGSGGEIAVRTNNGGCGLGVSSKPFVGGFAVGGGGRNNLGEEGRGWRGSGGGNGGGGGGTNTTSFLSNFTSATVMFP